MDTFEAIASRRSVKKFDPDHRMTPDEITRLMEAVILEKAPKVAIYTPPNSTPWDDAVTMALDYAGIDYDEIWDAEVLGENEPCPMERVGLRDVFATPGTPEYLFEKYGMSAGDIVEGAHRVLGRKG